MRMRSTTRADHEDVDDGDDNNNDDDGKGLKGLS